jgi:hypothetical protein
LKGENAMDNLIINIGYGILCIFIGLLLGTKIMEKREKSKKILEYVNVYGVSNDDRPDWKEEIVVGPDRIFKNEYAADPTLYDKDGNVLATFEWRAGYTIKYFYIYSKEKPCTLQ